MIQWVSSNFWFLNRTSTLPKFANIGLEITFSFFFLFYHPTKGILKRYIFLEAAIFKTHLVILTRFQFPQVFTREFLKQLLKSDALLNLLFSQKKIGLITNEPDDTLKRLRVLVGFKKWIRKAHKVICVIVSRVHTPRGCCCVHYTTIHLRSQVS